VTLEGGHSTACYISLFHVMQLGTVQCLVRAPYHLQITQWGLQPVTNSFLTLKKTIFKRITRGKNNKKLKN